MKATQASNTNFYVYALLDPRKPGPFYYGHWKFSHEPFYIGKGKGERAYSHLSRKNQNPSKDRIVRQLKRLKLNPLIVFKKKKLTERDAFDNERKLIICIGRKDLKTGCLVNRTNGGEGFSCGVFTQQRRDNLSRAMKGRTFTKKHLANLSKSLKGIERTKEWLLNMSKAQLGKVLSKETREKMSKSHLGVKKGLYRKRGEIRA